MKSESAAVACEMDQDDVRYWARRGAKTGAFLLVIPGATVFGYGLGMLLSQPKAYGIMGFGAGLLIWGLVVALGD